MVVIFHSFRKNKEAKCISVEILQGCHFVVGGPKNFKLLECVRLIKWYCFKYFSVSLKFGACYITGQWCEFRIKNAFFVLFHYKISVFFFWWSIKFPPQNINQLETGIGGPKLSVELYVYQIFLLIAAFKKLHCRVYCCFRVFFIKLI